MRTLTQKRKPIGEQRSNDLSRSHHENNGLLNLQHSAGNRAINDLLGAESSDFAPFIGPDVVGEVAGTQGQPLDPDVRETMEQEFGEDLGRIRVHRDNLAAESARDFGANAYVVGPNIVFGHGQYQPHTQAGRDLLSHELGHAIQQDRAIMGTSLSVSMPGEDLETRADAASRAIDSGNPVPYLGSTPTMSIQRDVASGITSQYTLGPNLDEESLGIDLARRTEHGYYTTVWRTLTPLEPSDRVQVALAMMNSVYMTSLVLQQMTRSQEGRRLLDVLYDSLLWGVPDEEELAQANRIFEVKASQIPVKEFETGGEAAGKKIFPYIAPGFTGVFKGHTPLQAWRGPTGMVSVTMGTVVPGEFSDEAKTLPADVFTSHIEIPETEIVGIKMYDQGGVIINRPALYLVQLSNEQDAKILEKSEHAFMAGLTFGPATLLGGVEATLAARILASADRIAFAIGTLVELINENRAWIRERFGDDFLDATDRMNDVLAIYGKVRLAIDGIHTLQAFGSAYGRWRSQKQLIAELSADKQELVRQLGRNADDLLNNSETIRRSQNLPPLDLSSEAGTQTQQLQTQSGSAINVREGASAPHEATAGKTTTEITAAKEPSRGADTAIPIKADKKAPIPISEGKKLPTSEASANLEEKLKRQKPEGTGTVTNLPQRSPKPKGPQPPEAASQPLQEVEAQAVGEKLEQPLLKAAGQRESIADIPRASAKNPKSKSPSKSQPKVGQAPQESSSVDSSKQKQSKSSEPSTSQEIPEEYLSRSDTKYPASVWKEIMNLEARFPKLKEARLRPITRGGGQPKFYERMWTNQGGHSLMGELPDGQLVELDDIVPDGRVLDIKIRTVGAKVEPGFKEFGGKTFVQEVDEYIASNLRQPGKGRTLAESIAKDTEEQLVNQWEFAKTYGLRKGVVWRTNDREYFKEVRRIIAELRQTGISNIDVELIE
jgi:hypothetical protein